MPTVKLFEIAFGALLLTGVGIQIAIIFLSPIIFMIAGLHILHNPKWAPVVLPVLIPFLVLLVLHENKFEALLH